MLIPGSVMSTPFIQRLMNSTMATPLRECQGGNTVAGEGGSGGYGIRDLDLRDRPGHPPGRARRRAGGAWLRFAVPRRALAHPGEPRKPLPGRRGAAGEVQAHA